MKRLFKQSFIPTQEPYIPDRPSKKQEPKETQEDVKQLEEQQDAA